ncbi:GNAT family N-acetyltransferase [Undibacterium sp. CY18W]|uniref:GNAT family N-acetyltransferase n=1 Tax=Undibacterium hunanense TaxID=2762292 RepID=A0ABR6ZMG2_9BURK|nr:GNAT family N-acetyltransferase [Undibacterium hunanense]MBC3917072.1 GNAT family N-acetyltransferase [Undibacterium hunanense]
MTTWTQRTVTLTDSSVVACHRYYREQEKQCDEDVYVTWLKKAILEGRYFGLLAENNGEIIAGAGIALLDWGPTRDDPNPYRARIVNVFTVATMRRQGIARSLVANLLKQAEQQGIKTFSLAASEDGFALYQELGFLPYKNEMLRKLR